MICTVCEQPAPVCHGPRCAIRALTSFLGLPSRRRCALAVALRRRGSGLGIPHACTKPDVRGMSDPSEWVTPQSYDIYKLGLSSSIYKSDFYYISDSNLYIGLSYLYIGLLFILNKRAAHSNGIMTHLVTPYILAISKRHSIWPLNFDLWIRTWSWDEAI